MMRKMPTIVTGIVAVLMLSGCAQQNPPLYMWEKFPRQQYDLLLGDGSDMGKQIETMEEHSRKAREKSAALPPGFRGHLGILYLNSGNPDRAKGLWEEEMAVFPESSAFMKKLLLRLDGAGSSKAALSGDVR